MVEITHDECGGFVHFVLDMRSLFPRETAMDSPTDYNEYNDDTFLLAERFWEQEDFIWN